MGSPAARAAATDGHVLTELVRAAFRNSARYYVQLARTATVDENYLDRRLVWENPDTINAALADLRGALFVGLHMGWYELPALVAALRTGRPAIVPSETIADPELQDYLVSTRRKFGLELIELASAKRRLKEALLRGDTVGILGDRDITGGGIEVDFFGAPAPLAAGPALLAMDADRSPYVFGVWRDASGTHHVRVEQLALPSEGTRRERVTGYLPAEARAVERL